MNHKLDFKFISDPLNKKIQLILYTCSKRQINDLRSCFFFVFFCVAVIHVYGT